jgi:hypothetical protein
MFCVSFRGLYFNGFYHAFQAEMWVGLRWCVHTDLCELNIIYYETIGYIQRLLYHDMLLVPKTIHVQHRYALNGKMKVKKATNKSMMNDLVWVKR